MTNHIHHHQQHLCVATVPLFNQLALSDQQKVESLVRHHRFSRGDQILNARSYAKQGFSEVLDEDVATKDDLIAMVHKVFDNKSHYIESMEKSAGTGGVDKIIGLINEITDK